MAEHRRHTVAERLSAGEQWIAHLYPKGVTQEDINEAEDYARKNNIFTFVYKKIAIVYYSDESKRDQIELKVAYYIR